MKKIVTILGQVGLVYLIAFIWFLDGVRGFWTDVLQKTATGHLFLHLGAKEQVGAQPMISFAGSSAAVHTAIIFFGLGIGSKHKGDILTMAKATAIVGVVSFIVLLFCFLNRHNWVYKYGSMFFHDDGCIAFAISGAASMPIWFACSMIFAQMDDAQTYLFPAIVARYCERGVVVYIGTAAFFRFLCVPVWNYVFRFIRVIEKPYPLITGEGTNFGSFGNFQSDLVRVGSITHTVAFAAGTAACCVVNKMIKRPSKDSNKNQRTDSWVLTSLVSGFIVIMSHYISFAFESEIRHIHDYATVFLGERRGVLEAFLCLSCYAVWFAAGVYFEQKWSGSASNNAKQPANELSIRTKQETADVDIAIGVIFIIIVWVLTLPLSWTLAASIVYVVMNSAGLGIPDFQGSKRPSSSPNYKKTDRIRQVIGSHRHSHSSIWNDMLSRTSNMKKQHVLILSLSSISVRLAAALIERDSSTVISIFPMSSDTRIDEFQSELKSINNCTVMDQIASPSALKKLFTEGDSPNVIFNLSALHYGNCKTEFGSVDVSTHHKEHVTSALEMISFVRGMAAEGKFNTRIISAFNASPGGGKEWALQQANSVLTDPLNSVRVVCLRFGNIFGPDDQLLSRHLSSRYALVSGMSERANIISVYEVIATLLKADSSLEQSDVLSGSVATIHPHKELSAIDFFKSVSHYRPLATTYQIPSTIPDKVVSVLFSSFSFFVLGCQLSPGRVFKALGKHLDSRLPVVFTGGSSYCAQTETDDSDIIAAITELNTPCYTNEHSIQHCLDEYDYEQAKENLAQAEREVQLTKELISRFEEMANLTVEKSTAALSQKKDFQNKSTSDKHTLPIVMCNPVTGGAVRSTPRCTAKAAFTSVINDLCTTLGSLSCGNPIVEEDDKGYDIVYPISGKLTSHLTDFLRKRVNPKLKEHVLFKGKCIRVNLLAVTDAVALHHTVYGDVSSLGY